ncbi:hypothetical protein ABIB51_003898 [Arthrobacter sp. UYCu712]
MTNKIIKVIAGVDTHADTHHAPSRLGDSGER